MGINFLLPIIAGIAMTIMVGTQFAPSIVDNIKSKKIEYATINNQDMIFEATKRYITLTQTNPSGINDLINGGFLDSTKKNNGFGEEYEIFVDGTKGILTITTKIADTKAQQLFLKSFNNKNVPTQVSGTNNFETKYVLPTDIMHGSGLFLSGIEIGNSAPDPSKKYWYDTSGDKVVLRMSDGTNWKEVKLVGGGVSVGSIETFAGVAAKIPEGYLLCNGQEVSRTTYKDLFDVIGTTYGSSSATTFKVPDLSGKFIRGNGSATFNSDGYGNTTHSSAGLGVTQGDSIRNITGYFGGGESWGYGGATIPYAPTGYFTSGGTRMYGISFDASRVVPTANENRPINIAMNYIIKY